MFNKSYPFRGLAFAVLAAAGVGAGPVSATMAGETTAAPVSGVRLAAVDAAGPAAEAAWLTESAAASAESCRPIRRLGGKVRIARRGSDCGE